MAASPDQFIEHEVLTMVLLCDDNAGYPTSLPQPAGLFRDTLADLKDRDLVDALKRLQPLRLTLGKYDPGGHFWAYPVDISDDGEFLYRGDFRLRRTPHTSIFMNYAPYLNPRRLL